MSTEEAGKKVVELVRKQAWYEALDTLYDDDVVSVEAYSMGAGSPETRGKEGVRLGQKNERAQKIIRSRRLHSQGRKDRPRRIFTARRRLISSGLPFR
jgi:hypothetical protein